MNTFETNINVKTGLPFTREEMLAYYKDIRDREHNLYLDTKEIEGTAPNLFHHLKKIRRRWLTNLVVGDMVEMVHHLNPGRECDSGPEFAKVIEVHRDRRYYKVVKENGKAKKKLQKDGVYYKVQRVDYKEVKIYDDEMGHTKWMIEIIDSPPKHVCPKHKDLYEPTFIVNDEGQVETECSNEDRTSCVRSTWKRPCNSERKHELWHLWIPKVTDHYSF